MPKPLRFLAPALAALALSSCGGGGPSSRGVPVSGVSLDRAALSLSVGAQAALSAAVQPPDAANRAVAWSSSNAGVATVTATGVVKAVAAGAAAITATTQEGRRTATCAVTVVVPVTGVSVSPKTMELSIGQYGGTAGMAHATVSPGYATNKAVIWTSSDNDIASVGGSGQYVAINGITAGKATITVTTVDGGKTATCEVTVKGSGGPVADVVLDKTSMDLVPGGQGWLRAILGDTDFIWSSDNEAVATVTALANNGMRAVVRAAAVGTAAITARARKSGKTASCIVTVAYGPDVYVAGASSGTGATLWKNGAPRHLGSGQVARSVFVSGDDVYVAGTYYDQNIALWTTGAMLWTNGFPRALSLLESAAYSVHASGGVVCVAGSEQSGGSPRATLWVNGAAQRLSDFESEAYSVHVSDGDIYVAGYEKDGGGERATIWKNGAPTRLTATDQMTHSIARSVFVSGGDVYAGGLHFANEGVNRYYFATVWKNGAPQHLDVGDVDSVYVDGGDVHAAGYYIVGATLWKNGVRQRLNTGVSYAHQVFASGGDVYAAGYIGEGTYTKATLWKNGVPLYLDWPDATSHAHSVFVETRD